MGSLLLHFQQLINEAHNMDVSSSDLVFISCHKHLSVHLHVGGGGNSLTARTHLLNDDT
jgi:hypothetical protein